MRLGRREHPADEAQDRLCRRLLGPVERRVVRVGVNARLQAREAELQDAFPVRGGVIEVLPVRPPPPGVVKCLDLRTKSRRIARIDLGAASGQDAAQRTIPAVPAGDGRKAVKLRKPNGHVVREIGKHSCRRLGPRLPVLMRLVDLLHADLQRGVRESRRGIAHVAPPLPLQVGVHVGNRRRAHLPRDRRLHARDGSLHVVARRGARACDHKRDKDSAEDSLWGLPQTSHGLNLLLPLCVLKHATPARRRHSGGQVRRRFPP